MKTPTRKALIQLLDRSIAFIVDHNKKLNSGLTSTQVVNLFYSSNEELAYLIAYRNKVVGKKRKTSNISRILNWMYRNGWKLQSVVVNNSKRFSGYLSYKDQGVVHLFTITDTITSLDDIMKRAQSIMNSK